MSTVSVPISATFIAAVRSVGTAGTMAMMGFYLHRKKFVSPEGKSSLARISQQVTIPAFLFTKIIYCKQDHSNESCPSITDSLRQVWILACWPLYVVMMGLLVGELAARWSNTPEWQRRSVLASCAFANSTGLPITLLAVIHSSYPEMVDPTNFLAVYLLLYPILQWGLGGWLLAPAEPEPDPIDSSDDEALSEYDTSATVGTEMSIDNGYESIPNTPLQHDRSIARNEDSAPAFGSMRHILNFSRADSIESYSSMPEIKAAENMIKELSLADMTGFQLPKDEESALSNPIATPLNDVAPVMEVMIKVAQKGLQPPVIAAILGLLVASIVPLRSLFVDMHSRDGDAILEWLYDGLYSIGQAAVPINMIILGINLSLTSEKKMASISPVAAKTIQAIVIAKMVVMPVIGVLSAILLKTCVLEIPESISTSFYLVMMIVFITPTANNVMVMVELSGSGTKEGMARIIGWQYATAPVLLSLSVMLVVYVAHQM